MTHKIILFLVFLLSYNISWSQTSPVSGALGSTVNEAEAHIAINPSDSNQMAVGYMEQNNGLSFKIYYSTDAGNTWTPSSFNAPAMSSPLLPGAAIAGGGDIILAYDKTGKLYASWIYLYYKQVVDSALFTGFWASSLDSGQSFQFENINNDDEFFGRGVLTNQLQNITSLQDGICDRQWMAVDHSNGSNTNRLYLGCVNYTNSFGGLKVRSKSPTSSGFGNFTTAVAGSYQLSNLGVDGNGVLHYSFAQTDSPFGIYHISSSDGGNTFSNLHTVSSSLDPFPAAPHYVNDRENAAPSLAIDGDNNLHIAWTDYPANQAPQAYYARSTDGGTTWSTPLDLSAQLGLGTFFANVSAHGNKVSLSTYGLDGTKKSDYYLMVSNDNGQTLSPAVKLTSQQSDFGNFATTDFPGDYTSSARTSCRTFSVWADLSSGGQPKLYLSKYTDCAPVGFQELTTINSPFQLISLYPNPANNFINVALKSKNNYRANIGIYSMDGKKLAIQEYPLKKGKNSIRLDINSLANGYYYIIIKDKVGNKISRLFSK